MTRPILLFVLFALLGGGAAHAQQTKEEIQKTQQDLQRELAELTRTRNSILKNKKISLKELALVNRKIHAREELVGSLNKQVRLLDEDIYHTTLEINRMKRELDTLKKNYAQSLVFAYKNRSNYDYLNFLFSAADFNDAMRRIAYLRSYRQFRETQADNITKTENVLEQKAGFLNTSKQQKSTALTEQGKQLKVLEVDRKEKDEVVQDLKGRENEVARQVLANERKRRELSQKMANIIRREADEARRRDQQRLADERKRQQAAAPSTASGAPTTAAPEVINTPKRAEREYSPFESTTEGLTESLNFEANRGRLPWPVDAGFIALHYGTYEVPNTKLRGSNDGIDISVPKGAVVKAIADGEVKSVTELSGDEKVVLIGHGKYFTSYSPLTGVTVSKGARIKAGTVLGRASVDDEGEGTVKLMVLNEKGGFMNPETWLRSRH